MISLSTRFLAQPREMRLTLIMIRLVGVCLPAKDEKVAGKQAPTRRIKSGGHGPPLRKTERPAALLLGLDGGLDAGVAALVVGDAAFLFDVFVELLTHIIEGNEGKLVP